MRACILLALLSFLHGAEVPMWVLRGIAAVETSSVIHSDGTLTYVNHAVGAAGEIGMFQMKEETFKEIALPGERFQDLWRPVFALVCTERYLLKLHQRWPDWRLAVEAYNTGHPSKAGERYYNKVRSKGL